MATTETLERLFGHMALSETGWMLPQDKYAPETHKGECIEPLTICLNQGEHYGVNLEDALNGDLTDLDEHDKPVCLSRPVDWKKAQVVVQWQHGRPKLAQILRDSQDTIMTNESLARFIAPHVSNAVADLCQTMDISPPIPNKHVFIVYLERVTAGAWQPTIWVSGDCVLSVLGKLGNWDNPDVPEDVDSSLGPTPSVPPTKVSPLFLQKILPHPENSTEGEIATNPSQGADVLLLTLANDPETAEGREPSR